MCVCVCGVCVVCVVYVVCVWCVCGVCVCSMCVVYGVLSEDLGMRGEAGWERVGALQGLGGHGKNWAVFPQV